MNRKAQIIRATYLYKKVAKQAVITRFIDWFHDFGIPVGGVIVNMLIDNSQVKPTSSDFVRNRVPMQERCMNEIWTKFDGRVRSVVPRYETEARGAGRIFLSLFAVQRKELMKRCASLFLLILLLEACAPAQVVSPNQTRMFSATPKQVTPPATDTPHPPTSTPRPPTATTNPTQAFITMVMSTKVAWRTMEALTPTPTLTATILPDSPACRPEDLHVSYGQSAASGHISLDIRMYNASSTNCFLPASPVVQILDPTRKPYNIIYSYLPADGPVVPIPPTDEAQPGQPARFGLERGQSAVVSLWWGNWCDKRGLPKEFIIHLELLDEAGKIEVANHDFLGSPACYDPATPSTINVEPFFTIANP